MNVIIGDSVAELNEHYHKTLIKRGHVVAASYDVYNLGNIF